MEPKANQTQARVSKFIFAVESCKSSGKDLRIYIYVQWLDAGPCPTFCQKTPIHMDSEASEASEPSEAQTLQKLKTGVVSEY